MSDTFLFFFQDTKAIFSKHVCKDYINSVPIFLLLLFLFFPFYMSMFICVCTNVTQLFFQSVFLLLPNDIKHFLPLLCWCIFCGPKVVQFLVFNRQDKKPPELSVICLNQNMGLCKVLSKTELEGERGGCCDRLLQNSGYNIN